MEASRNRMIGALGQIDGGLQQVADGFTTFRDASQTVSRAVLQEHGKGEQFTLEQTIGTTRLLELILRRMRTLGLDALLDHARTPGTLAETVSATLTPKIERLLP